MSVNPGFPDNNKFDFIAVLNKHGLNLKPFSVETLQVNITRLCNQSCIHCHVDASPKRTEQMDKRGIERCLEILSENEGIKNLDITGGAPELNPHFDYFVIEARKLGKHILVRHNLTVTLDGNPQTKEKKEYLPSFFAGNSVEVISSLPYYQPYFTNKQRGSGVFEKSIESIRLLNSYGYGKEGTGLKLDLVYNPVGAFLPAAQSVLEKDFKTELWEKYGLMFNSLYTMTNLPVHRFKQQLERLGIYEEYMEKLLAAFNPSAATGLMCRSLISIGYDGAIYDCDFNQMMNMQVYNHTVKTIYNFNIDELVNRNIQFASHCFGCAAGSGSSCGGSLVK